MLREDARLGDAWMLAITVAAKGRMADSVLNAGADDYLHRPFTRAELIARTRAGLRAAQERANDRLLRTLMENVPGAIYRCAWHAENQLEMITDEIERISGYPPPTSCPRTSARSSRLVHPEDLDMVLEAIARLDATRGAVRARVPDRARRRRGALGARPRPARRRPRRPAVDGRRDVRHHRAQERRGGAAAPRGRGGPHRRAARLALAHHRGRRQGPPQDRARPPRRRPAAAGGAWCSTSRWPSGGWPRTRRTSSRSSRSSARELQDASAELRELARGIHPAVLTERGLTAAVRRRRDPLRRARSRSSTAPEDRLPPAVEATAYFTVAEALTNVAKYAEATHAVVTLDRVGRRPGGRGPRRRDRRRAHRRRLRPVAGWPTASARWTGR